ncbi:cyclic nucleotide-binding domain-containing protein 1 isoform X5 [Tamandua tetradactyla]|uniref:cyclic nucleotide-binding domain-containing protein 1 isoform X5 n=1 Tax=Tamandua tetradactyla TaxID=48850 RepID=UPI0040547BB6
MPMSPLPAALLAHMAAVSSVPPPPLRSVPRLKISKHINYNQLNTLCHIRGLQYSQSSCSILSAHNNFMKQYPKIFIHKKVRLPKLYKLEDKRKPTEDTGESQPQQPDDSHNIAVHVKKAHGDHTLYGPKVFEEKLTEFLAILKKLPVHRTVCEHNAVCKMLQTVPDLTSQLSDEHLKALSTNVISETWVRGSTVVGNDGFYIILKGLARPRRKSQKNLTAENESAGSSKPQCFNSLFYSEDMKSSLLQDRYPASRDSMEKIKLENIEKEQLIRKCPYYVEWPTLSIYELTAHIKWKKFPPRHVIVESGNIMSFVVYINSGYCDVYRSVVGLVKQQFNKVRKIRKLVYMGKLQEKESFGEISVLCQVPFTCTVITGKETEAAIIEDKDLFELDPVTKQLMLQTAKPTFGHLTDEDVKTEYLRKEQQKEWKDFKDKTIKNSLYYNGIVPGFGKWNHQWTSIPRNLKDTLINY